MHPYIYNGHAGLGGAWWACDVNERREKEFSFIVMMAVGLIIAKGESNSTYITFWSSSNKFINQKASDLEDR